MTRRFTIAFLLLTTACSLAPDYERPAMPVPAAYKESSDWATAQPELADAQRGPWWKLYNDPILDGLEDKATNANQDLAAAVARYDEARGASDVARADLFPQLNASGAAQRQRYSKNIADVRQSKPFNDYQVGGDLSWELDLWGRLRNMAKAGKKRADASAADLAAMDLEIHTEMATTYFSLRGADKAQTVLDEAVASYAHALKITQNRHDGGAAAGGDVDQAATQLHNAETLAADNRLNRAQLEHALALLAGEMPSSFTVAPMASYILDHTPVVATGLPSQLLEQRPDIAAAAYRVAAANADIGVARAAYFPTVTLGLMGGFESAATHNLFNAPSEFWGIGPSFTAPLFDGGRIEGLSDEAKAARNEAVANYRSTVLSAFGQVEDSLAANRELTQEVKTQNAAAKSAGGALTQAQNLYSGGLTTYLDVVVAQNIALQAQLDDANIAVRRVNASVDLIRALGGGWKGNADY